MNIKDYLISGNEYNSFGKTRGIINRVLTDLEKEFRDKKFAQSLKGSAALAVTSFYAAQMLKLEKTIQDESDDSAVEMLKELMHIVACTKEGQEHLANINH